MYVCILHVPRMVKTTSFKWSACTEVLARRLNIDPGSASTSEASRIALYEQVWEFARKERTRQHKNGSCFVLGISAPQGAGKTTLTKALEFMAEYHGSKSGGGNGYRCASLSLDDFYLKGSDQDQFSKDAIGNSLLRGRGNPGVYHYCKYHMFAVLLLLLSYSLSLSLTLSLSVCVCFSLSFM